MQDLALRIVITKDEDMFVAQCLEHDIAVQAADMETLQRRFVETVVLECGMGDMAAIPPAPPEFHQKWEKGLELQSTVDNAQMRLAA